MWLSRTGSFALPSTAGNDSTPITYEVYHIILQRCQDDWFEASTAGQITSDPPVSAVSDRTSMCSLKALRKTHRDKYPRSSFMDFYARLGQGNTSRLMIFETIMGSMPLGDNNSSRSHLSEIAIKYHTAVAPSFGTMDSSIHVTPRNHFRLPRDRLGRVPTIVWATNEGPWSN